MTRTAIAMIAAALVMDGCATAPPSAPQERFRVYCVPHPHIGDAPKIVVCDSVQYATEDGRLPFVMYHSGIADTLDDSIYEDAFISPYTGTLTK